MVQISSTLLGIVLATTASLMFAFQFLFVRLGTRKGSVWDVIFVTLLSNVVILGPLTVLLYDVSMPLPALLAFAGAGLCGSLLARISMFVSIKRIGASRTSPIVASNALFATILAVIVLGETLTMVHLAGVIMIVVGVAVVTYQTSENKDVDATRRELAALMLVPIFAAVFLGMEPIFVSIGLAAGASIIPGTLVAVTTALIGFTAIGRVTGNLPRQPILGEAYLKWYVGAGVVTTLGLVAAFTALEIAPVAIAVPLIQTSPLIVIGLSALFLTSPLEQVTPRIVASTVIIVVGATLVSLSG